MPKKISCIQYDILHFAFRSILSIAVIERSTNASITNRYPC